MTALNDGRNDIRLTNSDAKCLMENWVEERAVASIDGPKENLDSKRRAKQFKVGHKGLLTTEGDVPIEDLTTTQDDYRPKHPRIAGKGARRQLLEQMIFDEISKEVEEEFNPPPLEPEYLSTMQGDYHRDFTPTELPVTATHDYKYDQPVTFWTEHRDRVTGVSQVKTHDSPFRKNDAFTQPTDEYFNDPKPYEDELVPKM